VLLLLVLLVERVVVSGERRWGCTTEVGNRRRWMRRHERGLVAMVARALEAAWRAIEERGGFAVSVISAHCWGLNDACEIVVFLSFCVVGGFVGVLVFLVLVFLVFILVLLVLVFLILILILLILVLFLLLVLLLGVLVLVLFLFLVLLYFLVFLDRCQ